MNLNFINIIRVLQCERRSRNNDDNCEKHYKTLINIINKHKQIIVIEPKYYPISLFD